MKGEEPLPGLYDQPNPCDNADWLSYLFFNWPTAMIKLGASRTITLADLPPVSKHDEAKMLNDKLKGHWRDEYKAKGENATLYMPLAKTYWARNWFTGFYLLLESGVRIAQALVFGQLIRWFLGESNHSNPLMNDGYFLSFLIVLGGIAVTMLHHHAFFQAWRLGLQLRMCLSTIIFDKAANLSLRALSKVSLGHVVNLSSQDIEGFQLMGCFLHFTYQPVVESLAVLYFGIMEIGWPFVTGFALILLLIPMQKMFSYKLTSTRRITSTHTDKRIKLVNQALTGARLMKINGWEHVFSDLIEAARQSEVGSLLISSTMRGLNEAIFFAAPVIIACVTFSIYSALGNELSTSKIFVVLSYYNITQFSMTKFFALAVQATSESSVALNRIANFLKLEDEDDHSSGSAKGSARSSSIGDSMVPEGVSLLATTNSKAVSPEPDPTKGVELRGVSASWITGKEGSMGTGRQDSRPRKDRSNSVSSVASSSSSAVSEGGEGSARRCGESKTDAEEDDGDVDVLRDIHLEVNPGELAVVVGPVGCSKTSLLMAIMGELKTKQGHIAVRGLSLDDLSKGSDFVGNRDVDAAAIAGGATTATSGRGGKVPDGTATFAYAAQEPWIMSNTLRNNVLFGLTYDRQWYEMVIAACSLEQDLIELPNGDATIIGDKGVNLSGGQKARVGLARALYTKAHILLLDDPLSAVDSHVGYNLFHEAVCSAKLFESQGAGKKTVILVTHQVQFLNSEEISKVVVMDKGSITATGSYLELVKQGKLEFVGGNGAAGGENRSPLTSAEGPSASAGLLTLSKGATGGSGMGAGKGKGLAAAASSQSLASEAESDGIGASSDDLVGLLNKESRSGGASGREGVKDSDSAVAAADVVVATKIEEKGGDGDEEEGGPVGGPASLIVAEDKAAGEVQWNTFAAYGEALGGAVMCVFLTAIMCIPQVLSIMCNYWLALWSRRDYATQQGDYWIHTYVILVLVCVFASLLRAIVFFKSAVIASQNLHNSMLRAVLRAPIHFFDSNPIGRILNRFSKDTTLIDDMLPFTMYDFIQCSLMVLGAILVVCAGSPFIFLALLPLVWYFYSLRKYFLKTSREVKRIEALSRSPVFSHLSETLDGLVTIRALNRKQIFLDMHKVLINDNCRAFFSFIAASRWLGFRLDVIVTVLLMLSTFGAVACKEADLAVDPNLLAVGIMYVIQLAGLFQWCVRQSAEVESQMVSVERVLGFTRLPCEPALHGPANVGETDNPPPPDAIAISNADDAVAAKKGAESDRCAGAVIPSPPKSDVFSHRPNWPERGEVVAYRYGASYREDLPPVLQDVSFTIRPGSRVGVVGRTGAGKSTLVGSFLRLVNSTGGAMYIDGLDTSHIGLHDLRPRISVIPQTPFLFSGTVRQNLDPWNRHSDGEIWGALRSSGLEEVVKGKKSAEALARVAETAKARADAAKRERDSGQKEEEEAVALTATTGGGGGGLSGAVEEGGMNFSTGERQLLCLARAILQRNKILIMDEATANIDLETDSKVQSAIYEEFSRRGCTVITIAHRLHTVIDNDQILVLARGRLVENGHPHQLLCKYFEAPSEEGTGTGTDAGTGTGEHDSVKGIRPPRHSLASLVKQTGTETCLKLRRMAMSADKARDKGSPGK